MSELICSEAFVKGVNEPFDIRSSRVRFLLKTSDWVGLYNDQSEKLILNYLQNYAKGRFIYGIKNMPPFSREHSFISSKIVFKILHACEDKVDLISNSFNTKVLFLIRHPIPVTLSREVYPRLNVLKERFRANLNQNQNDFIRKTLELDNDFKNGIIDWVLQNYFILNQPSSNINLVTYEQLVQNPEKVIKMIAAEYSISLQKMMKNIKRASNTTSKSDFQTINKLKDSKKYDKEFLLKKWVNKVDDEQKLFVNQTLAVFEIDIYNANNFLPKDSYLLK